MIFFFELLVLVFEPILLFIGAIFSYLLGNAVLSGLNRFLYSFNTPCIEAITLIIALVSPAAFLFGVRHQKFLTQRADQHNFLVFLYSFIFGALITFLPIGFSYTVESEKFFCPAQITLIDKIAQSISTGSITTLIAFLSLDMGVIYARVIGVHLRKIKKGKKN